MNLIPAELASFLADELSFNILHSSILSGGDIHHALKVETTDARYFLKYNDHPEAPNMFAGEAYGLQILRKANPNLVPKVIHHGKANSKSFLILPYFETSSPNIQDWKDLGEGLARIHFTSSKYFGLDQDNYIGTLPQSNRQHENWYHFFAEERILPQVKMAFDHQFLTRKDLANFQKLTHKLPDLMPQEKPSLLHGDLWNGNILMTSRYPLIIDPAVYFGHREMDLAMTKLFGGFSPKFYQSYQEIYPLEKKWQERIPLFQMYYLLVHVNLFGFGYVASVKSALEKYL